MDVRITKTKERLRKALLDILKTRSLDEVSISEVCNKAGINRNTFYSHYSSVKALLEDIESQFWTDLISSIEISPESIHSVKGILMLILEKVRENSDMCTLLLSDYGDRSFLRSILLSCLPSAVSNWKEKHNLSEVDAKLLFHYISGGAANVIEEWIRNNFEEREEVLVSKLDALILSTQKAFIQ